MSRAQRQTVRSQARAGQEPISNVPRQVLHGGDLIVAVGTGRSLRKRPSFQEEAPWKVPILVQAISLEVQSGQGLLTWEATFSLMPSLQGRAKPSTGYLAGLLLLI